MRNGRFRKDFLTISLKQDLRLSCEKYSFSTGKNRAFSPLKMEGHEGNLNHMTYSVPLHSLHLLRCMVLSHFAMISILHQNHKNVQFSLFSSVTQLSPTLCDPMDCSMQDLPVYHQLLDFTQTRAH